MKTLKREIERAFERWLGWRPTDEDYRYKMSLLYDRIEELEEALEKERGYTQDELYRRKVLDTHATELEEVLDSVRMVLEPMLMGGTSKPSREFDADLKRDALEQIYEALSIDPKEGG